MRKYLNRDKYSYSLVLGNGSRDYMGWPLDLMITSYGWVTRKNKYGKKEGWADSDITIGPFSVSWHISILSTHTSLNVGYEFNRRRN